MFVNTPDDEWEWYLGQLFGKLLKNITKNDLNTVAELAPGFRYKIAYALKEINFNGILYVIDTSNEVLNFVVEKYKTIIPNATIIPINSTFNNAHKYINNNIDLFLSNHSVDDLIIFKYMNEYEYLKDTNLKEDIYYFWEIFLNDNNKENILEDIKEQYIYFFNKTNTKYVIMSQYKGNVFLNDSDNEIYNIVNKCFIEIKNRIITNEDYVNSLLNFYPFGIDDERYNYKELLDNMQNSKNWIAGIHRKENYG